MIQKIIYIGVLNVHEYMDTGNINIYIYVFIYIHKFIYIYVSKEIDVYDFMKNILNIKSYAWTCEEYIKEKMICMSLWRIY